MRFSPSSSHLPSPTARTLPRWGFSLAVSGRTMPLAVVSSSSTALTIRRSPRGFSFMYYNLRLDSTGADFAVGTLAIRVPNSTHNAAYRAESAVGRLQSSETGLQISPLPTADCRLLAADP